MTTHTSHPDIIKRLKRAEGHLKSIIGMFEEGRGCLDITQQLQAVQSAVTNAKRTLVHDHPELVKAAIRHHYFSSPSDQLLWPNNRPS